MIERIAHDELEYDGDIVCFEGSPFTGISVELFKDGSKQAEYEYKNGFKNNECKNWYPNGVLRERLFFRHRVAHGVHQEFYKSGAKKAESTFEWGIELERITWSEKGDILEHWKLDPTSDEDQYNLWVERTRQSNDMKKDEA